MRAPIAVFVVCCSCTQGASPLGLGGPDDAATSDVASREPDAGAADTGPQRDSGITGEPFCGSGAHPTGLVAVGIRGHNLIGFDIDGGERNLGALFDGPQDNRRLEFYSTTGRERIAVVVNERVLCDRIPCGLPRSMLIVIAADGSGWTSPIEAEEPVVFVPAILPDGRIRALVRDQAGATRSAIIGSNGVEQRSPPNTVIVSDTPVDGWWAAEWRDGQGSRASLAFVREDQVIDLPRLNTAGVMLWRGRWVFADLAGVQIAGPIETRSIALPNLADNPRVDGVSNDIVIVTDEGDRRWLVRLTDGATALIDPPLSAAGPRTKVSPDQSWLVLSDETSPRWKVRSDAEGLRLEAFDRDQLYPGEARPFESSYCTPSPQIDNEGRLSYGIRWTGRSGWYRETRAGPPELIGRPVHAVVSAVGRRQGRTQLIVGFSGRDTFCPLPGEWAEPVPDDALAPDQILLLPDSHPQLLLAEHETIMGWDPSGRCMLTGRLEEDGSYSNVLTDVTTAERRVVSIDADRVLAVHPYYFSHL